MPAIASWSPIPPAQAARQNSQIYANAQATNSVTALQQAVSVAVNTAIAAGNFTTTVSASSYPAAAVQAILLELAEVGYTASYSTSTITLSW
jgi:hypothetical protein